MSRHTILTPLLLTQLHLIEGKTPAEIAESVGVAQRSVERALVAFGLRASKRLPGGRTGNAALRDRDRLYDLYVLQEMSPAEIGELIGSTKGAVLYALAYHEIARRPQGTRPPPRLATAADADAGQPGHIPDACTESKCPDFYRCFERSDEPCPMVL
jgi:hypothetical protein